MQRTNDRCLEGVVVWGGDSGLRQRHKHITRYGKCLMNVGDNNVEESFM